MRFTHTVRQTQYYKFPVEAWRGLLDNPQGTFVRLFDIMCADSTGEWMLGHDYGVEMGKGFEKSKCRGRQFLNELGKVRVCFTITREMFWAYYNNQNEVKEWEWLLLLWWMALHTIDGRNRGANAIKDTTNAVVFMRAAGFSSWADYKVYQWNGDERILKYMAKPARYAARLRTDLMAKYDTFHAYSEKGRRGWCFILAPVNRQQAFNSMAKHMAARGGTKQQFKSELAEMKAKARKAATDSG